MRRLAALSLLLLAGMASAEGPTTAEEDLKSLGYISAAKPGAFPALPPTSNAYPEDILANMRMKLGGERPLRPEPQAGAATGGASGGH
ncbi:hypothetical protein PVT71_24335 (plasmid) [Salipiger sp. H15]|uniref:DUF4148 domain-containing protein n=1 Tax=Alloyangia sp. H15 TaxID=3029062 RepID=A0AAU8APC4_9RHOB